MTNPGMTFPLGDAILHSPAYPLITALHIIGFAMLVGAVTVFDLRVLGFSRAIPVRALARLCLPWAVLSLVLIVPTGSLLFMAHAADLLGSAAFLLKMGLLLLAVVLAIVFHSGPYGSVDVWNMDTVAPVAARVIATASILNWIAVIIAGSFLAR